MNCDQCSGSMREERLVVQGRLVKIKNVTAWHCETCGRIEYRLISVLESEPFSFLYPSVVNPPSWSRSRPVSPRGVNLRESDVEKFENISREDAEGILSARLPCQRKLPAWLSAPGIPTQLRFDGTGLTTWIKAELFGRWRRARGTR
jgi:YgiT-type zinc finger domain-containing protein